MQVDHAVINTATMQAVVRFITSPSHALLLSGPTGIGKKSLALSMAADLLGTSLDNLANEPNCVRIEPEEGIIAIAKIRELQRTISRTVPGATSIARVVIMQDADLMTRDAQNALLKSLEEPPESTVFILTSSRPARLLPTIASRVQTIHVQPHDRNVLEDHFMKNGNSRQQVDKAFALAGNNLEGVQNALESDVHDDIVSLVKTVLSSDAYGRLLIIDAQLKDKSAARMFVDTLVLAASSGLHNSKNEKTLGRWQRVLEGGYTAQTALARNGNTKLVLTELMLAI